MRRKLLIACAILVAVLFALWCVRQMYLPILPPPQLPLESEIIKMRVVTRDWPQVSDTQFDVPHRNWNRILKALSQASRDDHADKWLSYGLLRVTNRDGSTLDVHLFYRNSQDDKAAFAVERGRSSRTYYRGGSQTELLTALSEAQAAAPPIPESDYLTD